MCIIPTYFIREIDAYLLASYDTSTPGVLSLRLRALYFYKKVFCLFGNCSFNLFPKVFIDRNKPRKYKKGISVDKKGISVDKKIILNSLLVFFSNFLWVYLVCSILFHIPLHSLNTWGDYNIAIQHHENKKDTLCLRFLLKINFNLAWNKWCLLNFFFGAEFLLRWRRRINTWVLVQIRMLNKNSFVKGKSGRWRNFRFPNRTRR